MSTNWFVQEPIAHRGYHWVAGIDENSWEAFELALEAKVPIECDLHLSKDGEVFIHHDHDLLRMTGNPHLISELSSHELKKVKTYQSKKGILPLKELLKLVKGQVPLVLEVKRSLDNDNLEKRVLEIMQRYQGDFSLQSFHPRSLIYMRENAPEAIIGLLSGEESLAHLWAPTRVLLQSLSLVSVINPSYIGYEWSGIHRRAPQEMRKRGIPLLAWTVRDEKSLGISQRLADNIIYENLNL